MTKTTLYGYVADKHLLTGRVLVKSQRFRTVRLRSKLKSTATARSVAEEDALVHGPFQRSQNHLETYREVVSAPIPDQSGLIQGEAMSRGQLAMFDRVLGRMGTENAHFTELGKHDDDLEDTMQTEAGQSSASHRSQAVHARVSNAERRDVPRGF